VHGYEPGGYGRSLNPYPTYGTLLQLDEIALAVSHAQQFRRANCAYSPHRDQPETGLETITEFLKNAI
jgi:hypothetical protein